MKIQKAACLALGMLASISANARDVVHDAEFYVLKAQHGERWAKEDKSLDAKLAELEKKCRLLEETAKAKNPNSIGMLI